MEEVRFAEAITTLKEAASDFSDEGDYLSFATLLDEFTEDWASYNPEQRIMLLNTITELMGEYPEILKEINWDLIGMVFPFVDEEWPLEIALKKQPFIKAFWQFCNLLAEKGTSPQLLLTCCDMLANLKDPVFDIEVPSDLKDELSIFALKETSLKCFALKFHALMQLIQACLADNTIIYASKALSKVVVALLNFYKSAPIMSGHNIVIRRVLVFIRDYRPPKTRQELLQDQNSNELIESESYFQRKLLVFLLAYSSDNLMKQSPNYFLGCIFPSISVPPLTDTAEPTLKLMHYAYSSLLSMDVDITDSLSKETKRITLAFDQNIDKLKTADDIFRHVITIYNNMALRDKNPEKLPIPISLLITIYIYGKYIQRQKLQVRNDINAIEIIKVQLQLFLPYHIDPNSGNVTAVIASMVWIVNVIQSDIQKSTKLLRDPKNKLLISTSLQTISSILISKENISFRRFLSTFLAKFMKFLSEDQSWAFIYDTLSSCPLESFVIDSVNLLKGLSKTDKYEVDDIDILSNNLENVKIKSTEASLPQVPKRPNEKIITLTEERKDSIVDLLDREVECIFKNDEICPSKANKLLSYLHFIDSLPIFDKTVVIGRVTNLQKLVEKHEDDDLDGAKTVCELIKFALLSIAETYKIKHNIDI